MSPQVTGALLGAVLALSALSFGFWGFVLVAVFMLIGALVPRLSRGRFDLGAGISALLGRRSSS
ncbi:DUF2273 domain-containing protein [Pseudarthrobacter sp. J1763]|uniref:DUF2273 domain-containing protein n=1 Tax=Pseudarthrobacter sp. J1763 TaxID=3420445 RepID=UPI003D269073